MNKQRSQLNSGADSKTQKSHVNGPQQRKPIQCLKLVIARGYLGEEMEDIFNAERQTSPSAVSSIKTIKREIGVARQKFVVGYCGIQRGLRQCEPIT